MATAPHEITSQRERRMRDLMYRSYPISLCCARRRVVCHADSGIEGVVGAKLDAIMSVVDAVRKGPLLGAALVGYLAGSLPSAELAQRLSGSKVDLRQDGSGNPGATNVDKLLGHRWGAAVLAADVAKGIVAAKAGKRFAGDLGANLAGTSAVLGHCFRRFGRQHGGKGVATRYGQLLVTDPRYFVIDFLVAFGVGRLTERGAVALTAAVGTSVVTALPLVNGRSRPLRLGTVDPVTAAATIASGAIVLVRFFQERGRPDELRRSSR
jgi:acyl-phosphate glycerol 3-phosphate acyltransferase